MPSYLLFGSIGSRTNLEKSDMLSMVMVLVAENYNWILGCKVSSFPFKFTHSSDEVQAVKHVKAVKRENIS